MQSPSPSLPSLSNASVLRWSRHLLAGFLGIVVLTMACDSPTGPSLASVGPMGQLEETAAAGADATAAVKVLGKDGRGAAGIEVVWTVEAGGGAVSPDRSSTDADGVARTIWTVGTAAGENRLAATAAGLAPIRFSVVVVAGGAASLAVRPDSARLTAVGDSVRLRAFALDRFGNQDSTRTALWASADSGIARVSAGGWVIARGPGSTQVSAMLDGKTGAARIEVRQEVDSLRIIPAERTLTALGDTFRLSTLAFDANAIPVLQPRVLWSGGDSIARVDSLGLVTALRPGSVRIHGRAGTGADSALVRVSQLVDSVAVGPSPAGAVLGQGATLQATALDSRANPVPGVPFVWSSSETSVATVDDLGRVTTRGAGVTTITARGGGISGSVVFTVRAAISEIVLAPVEASVAIGEVRTLAASFLDDQGRPFGGPPVAWSSASPAIATVSASGAVTGVSPGVAIISASAEGKSAAASITVTTATQVILPAEGGVVTAQGGAVVLTAPAGAVSGGLPVTVRPESAGGAAGVLAGTEFELGPDGTVFAAPVQLAIRFDPARLPQGTPATDLRVVKLVGGLWRPVEGSQVDAPTSTVRAPIQGFSRYAIAPTVRSVRVTPAAPTVTVGTSLAFNAELADAGGATLRDRAVSWTVAPAPLASVDAAGRVTGVAPGSAIVTATSEGASGSTGVTVIAATVPPSPATSQITADSAQMRANGTSRATIVVALRDATGAPLTTGGHAVTLATTAGTLGAVQDRGDGSYAATLTAPLSAGIARVTGTVAGAAIADDASITLLSVVATVEIAAGKTALEGGETEQLTATLRDSAGAVVPQTGRTIAWSSSNGALATVGTTGLVTGGAPGLVTITATIDGKSASRALTVLPSGPVELQLVRFDGGSGSTVISSGIPLPPGRLRAGELAGVVLVVAGVEQPLYVEALAGRHGDGSLRSVLLQTAYAVGATPVAAKLYVGSQRRTTDRARVAIPGSMPTSAALPSDPAYLVSTDLVGPTLTSAATRLLGAAYQQYESDYAGAADNYWTECGPQWDCNWGNYYDRAHTYFAMWARTGNREYWRRGMLQALNYRDVYLVPNDYGTSPHWSQMRGMETHYLLSGDEGSRTAIATVANRLYGGLHTWFDRGEWDTRHQARVLESYFLAWRLGDTSRNWAVALDEGLTSILGTQAANGSYPITWECSESLPYMIGILNDMLAKYHRYYRADPRIPTAIARSADWMWTQWVAADKGFRYIDVSCPDVGLMEAAPDLNLLIVNSYGWAYQYTANGVYLTRGDEVFREGVAHMLLIYGKQFNEAYSSSFLYPALRAR